MKLSLDVITYSCAITYSILYVYAMNLAVPAVDSPVKRSYPGAKLPAQAASPISALTSIPVTISSSPTTF